MIVIAPIIGSKNALVTPVAIPPWAATKASSPPEDDNPKPAQAGQQPYRVSDFLFMPPSLGPTILEVLNCGFHKTKGEKVRYQSEEKKNTNNTIITTMVTESQQCLSESF